MKESSYSNNHDPEKAIRIWTGMKNKETRRDFFKIFPHFNAVESKCIQMALIKVKRHEFSQKSPMESGWENPQKNPNLCEFTWIW